MAETRRTVLKAAALAGTAFFVPTGILDAFQDTPAASLGADNQPIRNRSRLRVTRSLLRGHLTSDFLAQTAGGMSVTLRLVEVADLPNAHASDQVGSEDAFSARFEDPSGVLLSQGTYSLQHEVLGRVSWFLVPVDQPGLGPQRYEAIFNNPPAKAAPPAEKAVRRR